MAEVAMEANANVQERRSTFLEDQANRAYRVARRVAFPKW